MHLLRFGSVKYVNLRLTILALSVWFRLIVLPYLAGASFIVGWTLSLTSCCLEKPERTEIKQVTGICFFHFPLYIILVKILYHAQNTACIGPQRKKSEFYSTHFHTIICDGSLINHSFKSLILKIGIYEFDLLKWCVKIVRDCALMS